MADGFIKEAEVIRKMAHTVVKVVERCENAKEDAKLDLSECTLMQVPDAIYHLMRDTELTECNLSCNVLRKIPTKFVEKFSQLTQLNLSHNHISGLPDEFTHLRGLVWLDISNNSFIVLPHVLFKMPQLREVDARNNAVLEIDEDDMATADLKLIDLRNNPLSKNFHLKLMHLKPNFELLISKREDEDEDEDDG